MWDCSLLSFLPLTVWQSSSSSLSSCSLLSSPPLSGDAVSSEVRGMGGDMFEQTKETSAGHTSFNNHKLVHAIPPPIGQLHKTRSKLILDMYLHLPCMCHMCSCYLTVVHMVMVCIHYMCDSHNSLLQASQLTGACKCIDSLRVWNVLTMLTARFHMYHKTRK